RRRVTRIEVVRIRPQVRPGEPVRELIEDPWRRIDCPRDPAGCTAEFDDPSFLMSGRPGLYYVRAVEEPTPAVNAGGLRCARDADRRDPPGEDDRRRVLDRLVDEELLVQRALELGLARRDRLVRAELAGAAIGLLGTTADAPEPTRAELEAFYDAHRDDFTEPGRIRVEQVFVGAASLEEEARAGGRAAAAARRLRAGDALAGVRRD